MNMDSTPDFEAFYFELLRGLTPARKMAMLSGLNIAAYRLSYQSLRERHPDESEVQLRYRMAEMMHGSEWAQRLFGEWSDLHSDDPPA